MTGVEYWLWLTAWSVLAGLVVVVPMGLATVYAAAWMWRRDHPDSRGSATLSQMVWSR